MRNKKGFTLIELLAVIAILGIVLGIATFAVTSVLNKSKTEVAEVDEGMIKKAAELYVNENYAEFKNELKSDTGKIIDINELVDNGYLSETTYTGTVTAKIHDNGRMEITVNAKQMYTADKSGANPPRLASGMIPVIYDEASGNWEVADISSEWYNYEKQMWANAVTTSNASYRSAPAGTEIPMSAINSMWVWIPRYKYKIPSNMGSSSNVASPPQIDVVFESGTSTTGSTLEACPIGATNCYYTHPAFRNGSRVYGTSEYSGAPYDQGGWDKELTGIWVGKFETGGSASIPLIKPDIQSLRSQTVYNQFVTSLRFAGGTLSGSKVSFSGNSTYGLTSSTDTHMMKNTEWGAVAYLSQSKYGKMGNSNYSGTNKEIYINNSSSYYTGRSGGSPSASSTTYGTCSYIGKACTSSSCTGSQNVLFGTGASTTVTVYGIYDMSGGTSEYTMSNWAGTVGSSGFTTSTLPGGSNGSKYYDKYTTGISSSSMILDKSIKGDATYETMKWDSDYSYFPYASSPWSVRGGGFNNASSAGVFYSGFSNGTSSSVRGFRVVLIP